MLNHVLSTLRNFGQSEIPVSFAEDADGYLDRECPSQQCLFRFKIFGEDWKEKIQADHVFCPNCGHTSAAQQWLTQEQAAHVARKMQNLVEQRLSQALTLDAMHFNRSQPRNSFISMSMKVESRACLPVAPHIALDIMRLRICCAKCSCRYAVIGAAYFCPACGHNSADQVFSQSVERIKRMLGAIEELVAGIPDLDLAVSSKSILVESGLQSTVTAFQRCAEALYSSFSANPKIRRNAFQDLDEGQRLWESATGKDYLSHLGGNGLSELRRYFQQRHLLAHTQGIVDRLYCDKSGDQTYKPGQRIVVRASAVQEAVRIVEKLVAGLKADAAHIVAQSALPSGA